MKILSTSHDLASALGPYVPIHVNYFPSGELYLDFSADPLDETVILVHTFRPPLQDSLMVLLSMAEAAKGARTLIAVVPYLAYTRETSSLPLIATLLEAVDIQRLITFDLHHEGLTAAFRMKVHNLCPCDLYVPHIHKDAIIVAPDIGSAFRAKKLAALTSTSYAILSKERGQECRGMIGDVQNRPCVIVDDILDSGETLAQAALFLKEQGATSIQAFVTHHLGRTASIDQIDVLWTTNTLPHQHTHVLSINEKVRSILASYL